MAFTDIRQHACNWTLASDAQLLNQLEEFASRLTAQAHQYSREVQQLVQDTQLTGARIESVTDRFLSLSDHQFIENRVYDEDSSTEKKTSENNEEEKEKTKEEREAELLNKVKEAVGFGIQLIDDSFDILDMKMDDSDLDSEDEEIAPNEIMLEPKDPYVNRPLPYLIGSRSFYQEDDVGIGELPGSDDVESEGGSVSDSDEEIEKAVALSDSSSSEEEFSDSDRDVEPVRRTQAPSSDSYSSSDNEDLFDKPRQPTKTSLPQQKPSSQTSDSDQDMFADDNDDLFAAPSGGLFGDGKGLFDAPKSNGLFDNVEEDVDEDATDDAEDTNPPPEEPVREPVKKSPVKKKTPLGGVSLFGGAISKGFFKGGEKSSDTSSSGDDAVPTATKEVAPKSGLFDDSSSDEDLFASAQPAPKKMADKEALFDEAEDSDDKDSTPVSPPVATKSKRPPGGVSLFGADKEESLKEIGTKKTRAVSSGSSEDNGDLFSRKPPPVATPGSKSKSTKVGLFDDEDSDDGIFSTKPPKFSSVKPSGVKSAAVKPSTPKGASKGLFSDSDDSTESPSPKTLTKTPPTAKPSVQKSNDTKPQKSANPSSLFDDSAPTSAGKSPPTQPSSESSEDEDLFSRKPPPLSSGSKPKGSSSGTKGLFDDEDEDDLFSSKPPKSSKTIPPSQKISTAPKTKGLFDDEDADDLFSSKPPKSSNTVPPSKKSSSKTVGLFDDDSEDDLLSTGTKPLIRTSSGTKGGLNDEDLFSTSSKPKEKPSVKQREPPQKKNSLFGSDSEDDLFNEKESKSSSTDPTVSTAEDTSKQEEEEEEPVEAPRKKLAGAVSMFGAGGGELLAAIGKRRSASRNSDQSSGHVESPPIDKPVAPAAPAKIETPPKTPPTKSETPKSFKITPKPFSPISKVTPPVGKKFQISINPAALLPGAAPKPRPPPDTTVPLESATKTRARGQAGRRPPSRHARRKTPQQVDEADSFFKSETSVEVKTEASLPAEKSKTNEEAAVKTSKPDADNFLDDLLGSSAASSKSTKTSKSEKKNLPSLFDDDIFKPEAKSSKSSKTKSKKVDLFADDEDLFGSIDLNSKMSDKKKSKTKRVVEDLDSLFDEPTSPVLPSKKKQITVTPEENLFDNTDIFAELPKPKKKVTKPIATKIDDDLDDIFATPVKAQKKKTNKSNPKQPKKEESSFDDPLNAFLS